MAAGLEPDRSADARDYLADDFHMQASDEATELGRDYSDFADWLRELPASDPLLGLLATSLAPFLDDEPRLGGTLYPLGEAIQFMDKSLPPREPADREWYLQRFVTRLERDHRRWRALLAEAGESARWTVESGVPEVTACLDHLDGIQPMGEPQYLSWSEYLTRVKPADARTFCTARIRKANAERLMSPAPERQLTAEDVWDVLAATEGRCVYCGSLCVERTPYDPVTKRKLPWSSIGRRIGSLHHRRRPIEGGGNDAQNLAWACLWCNTWACERRQLATDHGGLYPDGIAAGELTPAPWTSPQRSSL